MCRALSNSGAGSVVYVCAKDPGHGPGDHADFDYGHRWPFEVSDPLPVAALKLLRVLDEHDTPQGVMFIYTSRGCWRLQGSDYAALNGTFYVLHRLGYADAGNGNTSPVKITEAGRAYLAEQTGASR